MVQDGWHERDYYEYYYYYYFRLADLSCLEVKLARDPQEKKEFKGVI